MLPFIFPPQRERGCRVWPRVAKSNGAGKQVKEEDELVKVYNRLTKEIRWEDDISGLLKDTWFDITELLAEKKLDGHDEYDQWLMMVEHDLRHLIHTLEERDYFPTKHETFLD